MAKIKGLRTLREGTCICPSLQQANQPSTNVANFTDTDLRLVDMIPSKDPGNDFTTHGYSSLPAEVSLYIHIIVIIPIIILY